MFVSLDIFVWAPETFLCTLKYHSSESLTEAPDLVAGLWRPLYVEWRNYAINYVKRPINNNFFSVSCWNPPTSVLPQVLSQEPELRWHWRCHRARNHPRL
jgi:hypothetical protein